MSSPTGSSSARITHGQDCRQAIRRVVVTKKLVLRSTSALDSQRLGDILPGKTLLVVDQELVDGVIRCHVCEESEPRGLSLIHRGWVTAYKDGELKMQVDQVATARAVGSTPPDPELPWSLQKLAPKLEAAQMPTDAAFFRSGAVITAPAADSMASRIAKRRQSRSTSRSERRQVVDDEQKRDASTSEASSSQAVGEQQSATSFKNSKGKFTWSSSEELTAIANERDAKAAAQVGSCPCTVRVAGGSHQFERVCFCTACGRSHGG